MFKVFHIFIFAFLSLSINVFGQSKIYLIRHAVVQIESPGWCKTNETQRYKNEYNKAPVEIFDPEIVLSKIDNPETIDTIFCSPLFRALETANLLFDNSVILKIDSNLMELNYKIIHIPLLKLPAKVWQTISVVSWAPGKNQGNVPTYRQRKRNLKEYSDEIITYAEKHGKSVVVAHGMLNRELIRILKKKGWKLEQKDGFGNLSVNCMVK